LLPLVVEANIAALQAREPLNPVLAKYTEVARLLTGNLDAEAQDAVEWLGGLCADLCIPGLANYGFRFDEIPLIVEKAAQASSMKGNPLKLTPAEMVAILERAG